MVTAVVVAEAEDGGGGQIEDGVVLKEAIVEALEVRMLWRQNRVEELANQCIDDWRKLKAWLYLVGDLSLI